MAKTVQSWVQRRQTAPLCFSWNLFFLSDLISDQVRLLTSACLFTLWNFRTLVIVEMGFITGMFGGKNPCRLKPFQGSQGSKKIQSDLGSPQLDIKFSELGSGNIKRFINNKLVCSNTQTFLLASVVNRTRLCPKNKKTARITFQCKNKNSDLISYN